jgi:hypothetical protein
VLKPQLLGVEEEAVSQKNIGELLTEKGGIDVERAKDPGCIVA